MLADPCTDPGIFARVVQARLPENSSNNGFCLFFLNFYSFTVALQCFFFKENYNFTRFRGGWGGIQPIPGGAGAGGPNANSRNP